jgi:GAF domain-containing protein
VPHDHRLDDALARALAGARASFELELRTLAHELPETTAAALASAAHALDRAGSLSATLRALVERAGHYADRVGLFLVRDDRVRAWRLDGVAESALTCAKTDGTTSFPVVVGGRVVAVLCAESTTPRAGGVHALNVLTRYAGRLLESITLQAALGLTEPRPPAVAEGARAAGGAAAR